MCLALFLLLKCRPHKAHSLVAMKKPAGNKQCQEGCINKVQDGSGVPGGGARLGLSTGFQNRL